MTDTMADRLSVGAVADAVRLGLILRTMAKRIAAQEKMRYSLGAVRFRPGAEPGRIVADATNGRILVRVDVRIPSDAIAGEEPKLDAEFLVSRETLGLIRAGDGVTVLGGKLVVVDGRDGAILRTLGSDAEGTFPNVEDVIPKMSGTMDGFGPAGGQYPTLDPEYVTDLMASALTIRGSKRTQAPSVRWSYTPRSTEDKWQAWNPIRLDAEVPGVRWVGVLMPISCDTPAAK